MTAKIGERLGAPAHAPRQPRSMPEIEASSIDATDLLELDIPPLQWIVPDLLPEGTTVLAGAAEARQELPRLPDRGRGRPRRRAARAARSSRATSCTSRSRTASGAARRASGPPWATARCPAAGSRSAGPPAKLGEGLEDELLDWLDEHPDARLVAIDTLAARPRPRRRPAQRVRGRRRGPRPAAGHLQGPRGRAAHRPPRKQGRRRRLPGHRCPARTGSRARRTRSLVIQRKRLETFGKLVVTGRDVAEVEEPVQFDGMTWSPAPRSLAEASLRAGRGLQGHRGRGPDLPQGDRRPDRLDARGGPEPGRRSSSRADPWRGRGAATSSPAFGSTRKRRKRKRPKRACGLLRSLVPRARARGCDHCLHFLCFL